MTVAIVVYKGLIPVVGRILTAKYKDDVTPAAIHKVDSTRMDLGRRIVERFHRIVGVR